MPTYPLVVLVQSPYHVVFIGTDPVWDPGQKFGCGVFYHGSDPYENFTEMNLI